MGREDDMAWTLEHQVEIPPMNAQNHVERTKLSTTLSTFQSGNSCTQDRLQRRAEQVWVDDHLQRNEARSREAVRHVPNCMVLANASSALEGLGIDGSENVPNCSPKARGKQTSQSELPGPWKDEGALKTNPQLRRRSRSWSRRRSESQSTTSDSPSKSTSRPRSSSERSSIMQDENKDDSGSLRFRDTLFPELAMVCVDSFSNRALQANDLENNDALLSGWRRRYRRRIAELEGRDIVATVTRRNQYTDTPFPLFAFANGRRSIGRSRRRPRELQRRNRYAEYADTPFPQLAISNGFRTEWSPKERSSRSQSRSRSRMISRSRSPSRCRSRSRSRSESDREHSLGRYRRRNKVRNNRHILDENSEISTLIPTCERISSAIPEQNKIVSGIGDKPLHHIKLIRIVSPRDVDQQSNTPVIPITGSHPQHRQQVQRNSQIETTLCVSLEEFPIGSSPPFIALSYVWGSDVPSQNIRVNREPFAIRENLTTALRLLQLLCPGMYIWTDAICINQANEEEKSHLVQHMGQIFNAAEKVYAWLGPADPGEHGVRDSSDALWDHLQQLGDIFWEHTGHDRRLDQMPFDMDTILERLLPDLNARMTKPSEQDGFPTLAYSRFSNRVYWQRIWVLQEVYLAREVIFCCGPKTMISKTLAGALILLESYKKYVVSNSMDVGINPKLQEFAFTAPCYPEMHRLIIYTSIYPVEVHSLRIAMTNFCVKELPHGSQSTDPRDMVFGLLGFASQEERGYIKVDYKKTVQEVYRDTTRELMRRGWTDILAWSQPLEKRIPELPSWVPDFSSTIYETMCSQGQAKSWLSRFNASASLRPTFYTGDIKGDWGLRWPGVVVDVIDQIGSLWHPRGDPLDPGRVQGSAAMQSRSASYEAILTYLSEVKRFTEESIRLHPVPPRGIPYDNVARLEAAWRVPCADQLLVNSKFIRGDNSMQSAYKAAFEDATRCVNEAGYSDNFKPSDESRPYVETILRWVKKRPMLGILGHVGLVAGDTQKGDILVLLQNCSAPYVLRKRFSNPLFTSYDLVGEAFIWGIMDGEYNPREGQEFIFEIL